MLYKNLEHRTQRGYHEEKGSYLIYQGSTQSCDIYMFNKSGGFHFINDKQLLYHYGEFRIARLLDVAVPDEINKAGNLMAFRDEKDLIFYAGMPLLILYTAPNLMLESEMNPPINNLDDYLDGLE